jgi:hypothetical protein
MQMFTYTDFTHPSPWAPSDGNASPRFENIDSAAPTFFGLIPDLAQLHLDSPMAAGRGSIPSLLGFGFCTRPVVAGLRIPLRRITEKENVSRDKQETLPRGSPLTLFPMA